MILSAHQPVYLPGIILFNKIALSDAFMFLGHAQVVVQSWHMRNRIRQGDNEIFLTVPIQKAGRFGQSIDETQVAADHWKRKHLQSIRQAYGKRPFFDRYFPAIEALILDAGPSLGLLDKALIRHFLEVLEIDTPIHESQDYAPTEHKTALLIEICHAVGASGFLSNEGSRVYVDEPALAEAGLQHYWQVFEHPVYDQGRPFMPNLSIIDLLFNMGPRAAEIVRSCGRVEAGPYKVTKP
ncbi:MAG: WbqC family protein [Magnetospirillum sp.]|nr:WbqC family protein [Magnetospirillum sp.]